jgi:uncharacterized protein YneR
MGLRGAQMEPEEMSSVPTADGITKVITESHGWGYQLHHMRLIEASTGVLRSLRRYQ